MADPLYIAARRALLDALEAAGTQRRAIVLVGAQAIYLHTGDADLAVPAFTTDADLMLDPRDLQEEPLVEGFMTAGGFVPWDVGRWSKVIVQGADSYNVVVDLMVPESLSGPGTRAARIPPHQQGAARRARGLEAALVDQGLHEIRALDAADDRAYEVNAAGPAALLVAKILKIAEREGQRGRAVDKDALDVLRILRAISTAGLANGIERLRADEVSAAVTNAALAEILRLFGRDDARGSVMAARAAVPVEVPEVLAASAAALASDLLAAIGAGK